MTGIYSIERIGGSEHAPQWGVVKLKGFLRVALVIVVGGALATVSLSSSTRAVATSQVASSVVPGSVPSKSSGTSQGPTASTTPPAPSSLPALPGPSAGVQAGTPTPMSRPPAVSVSIPSVSCSTVGQALQASVTGFGPYVGMGLMQDIVSLRSSTPCFVSGYPTLTFTGPAVIPTTERDGATLGNPPKPQPVAVGTQYQASFLVQFRSGGSGSAACPIATSLSISIPGSEVSVPVSLAQMSHAQSQWSPCGGIVGVSPFEQENSVGEYASPESDRA